MLEKLWDKLKGEMERREYNYIHCAIGNSQIIRNAITIV